MASEFIDKNRLAFETFDKENPDVYAELVRIAREAKASGLERCSIRFVLEIVRWYRQLTTHGDALFAINNNHAPFYARVIMDENDDLVGFFETRSASSDSSDSNNPNLVVNPK